MENLILLKRMTILIVLSIFVFILLLYGSSMVGIKTSIGHLCQKVHGGIQEPSLGPETSTDQSWLDEQEKRQEALRTACNKYGKTASRVVKTKNFYFWKKDNLLYCKNNKASLVLICTTLGAFRCSIK